MSIDLDATEPRDVVMQTRCIYCGVEHYCMNVVGVSYGHTPCGRCGRIAPVYTNVGEYRRALRAQRERDNR